MARPNAARRSSRTTKTPSASHTHSTFGMPSSELSRPSQRIKGDAYLLPAIAAVVIGGTHILGGRGTYLGTVAGVLVITLLSSVLAVMQMPEASRQIIYGVVIIVMLLLTAAKPKE